ncbi:MULTISPECIES: flagellin [Thalassospira]|jgi:flagellar hook-associated protein 3 FlgL|nr:MULTISPECIES: flagellin [Thalassospira]MBL4842411.1 flagellin [Thalassospira sp.]MBR9781311.1 flagellin [Rhodospirillales bacterium]MBR9817554.1 flagellin [Rhodospirillales bacterium]OCK09936.1 flagellin domain protein [Thalassospira sp. KO164]PXX28005.1 flagellar hook-associated protein 3 FlgL [Thalassospira sp. 11-3]|tara:strand:- start:26197 stop:27108 length:912 start_codon:yes stop_codon:yes gene_type:complete
MRVSTAAMQQNLLNQMRSVQSQLTDATNQSSSGMKADSYSGVSDNSYVISTLSAEISESSAYADLAEQIQSRVEMYYSTLNDMVDLMSDMLADISGALSTGSPDVAGINESATAALSTMESLLNTQYEDRYLFAGSATNTAPVSVDVADYPAMTTPSAADTSYYSGNSDIASAKVADGTTIEYGLTADQEPFEQALRALNLTAYASADPIDEAALTEAMTLIEGAVEGIADLQTQVSLTQDELEAIVDMHTDFQLTAEGIVTDLSEVDLAEAMVNLETLSVQLEASYSVAGQIVDMSLFEYLR